MDHAPAASPTDNAARPADAPASPRFGVEIETVGRSREHVARAILAVVGGAISSGTVYGEVAVIDARGRRWSCVYDGSLSSAAAHAEVVTPILSEDDLPLLQEVVRAIKACGASVDRSTGIHIHVDGEPFDARAIRNLLKIWNKQEQLIFHAFRVSPERRSRYCKDNDPTFIRDLERHRPSSKEALNPLWYGRRRSVGSLDKLDSSRYRAVNLHSLFYRGTIEFRLFEGSLDSREVRAYVEFVLALARKALSARASSAQRKPFDPATAKYDFRVFLLHLGFIGDRYKVSREQLTKHLKGSAAWKNGRPPRAPRIAASTPTPNEDDGASRSTSEVAA